MNGWYACALDVASWFECLVMCGKVGSSEARANFPASNVLRFCVQVDLSHVDGRAVCI